VPHPAAQRLRRPPHRGHRRQARALDPQRAQHRPGDGHRRRGLDGLLRLFNEPAGRGYLERGASRGDCSTGSDLLGISGIANLLAAIKFARWFELGERDVVLTVATDSMELYGEPPAELTDERGASTATDAAADERHALPGSSSTDNVAELGYWDRKRIHNLKYFTWVEQQGKTSRRSTPSGTRDEWQLL
jgi:hypothetical protein